METRICLDTDFLVNLLRGRGEETEFARQAQGEAVLSTTIINVFELFYGAYLRGREKEIASVESLVDRLMVLPLSPESARLAGKLKAALNGKGAGLDFRDVLIGSIALSEGHALKTGNKKHFERIEGLRIL